MWPIESVAKVVSPVLVGYDQVTGDPDYERAVDYLATRRAVNSVTWIPGEPEIIEGWGFNESGRYTDPDTRVFNLYQPPDIEPGDGAQAKPWLDHVQLLWTDGWEHIVAWMASRVQQPQVKINHALVLGGAGVALLGGEHHAAAAVVEVGEFVDGAVALFEQHVLAGDAEVGRAGLHVCGHIGRPHRDEGDLAAVEDPEERRQLFDKMVAKAYENSKALRHASLFAIDDVVDPAESRSWVSGMLRSVRPERRSPHVKRRPGIDAW